MQSPVRYFVPARLWLLPSLFLLYRNSSCSVSRKSRTTLLSQVYHSCIYMWMYRHVLREAPIPLFVLYRLYKGERVLRARLTPRWLDPSHFLSPHLSSISVSPVGIENNCISCFVCLRLLSVVKLPMSRNIAAVGTKWLYGAAAIGHPGCCDCSLQSNLSNVSGIIDSFWRFSMSFFFRILWNNSTDSWFVNRVENHRTRLSESDWLTFARLPSSFLTDSYYSCSKRFYPMHCTIQWS